MTNEYEALAEKLLQELQAAYHHRAEFVDNLTAWKAVEQFAEKLQTAAYAEGRKDEAEAWPVPYVELKDAFFGVWGT